MRLNSSKKSLFKTLSKNLKAITTNPEDFLRAQNVSSKKILELLQQTYGFTTSKDSPNKNSLDILPQLIVDGLDAEQIWQLIELRNNCVLPQFLESTSKMLAFKEEKMQIKYMSDVNETDDVNESDEELKTSSEIDDVSESEFKESKQIKNKNKKVKTVNGKPSIVDDQFFKLSEMEAFLKAEDEKEFNKQTGKRLNEEFNLNLFNNFDDEDEDEENVCYRDFFNENEENETESISKHGKESDEVSQISEVSEEMDDKTLPNEFDDSEENESNESHETHDKSDSETYEEKPKPKSSTEDRQERLNQRIKNYEQEILGEKPWQLKGEIDATNRPQNSLLEEILEFEATSRPAPIITEETTLRLEDIIRQRIKDQVWDDVELKIKPLNTPQEYRKQLVLDQEKSKESLAHIYEKQYQNEIEKMESGDIKEDEEPKAHREIKELMRSLFVKLDALSNFHFTPKPVAPEPKIITNTPAVNMEEVTPIAVSTAKLLAPEEVRNAAKGDILGSNERTKTDKNRDRRHKKLKQKAIQKALEEKNIQKQKLGFKLNKKEETASITNKLTKRRNVEKISTSQDVSSMKSSKAFFNKLNETTMLQKNPKKKLNPEPSSFSAKKLKL